MTNSFELEEDQFLVSSVLKNGGETDFSPAISKIAETTDATPDHVASFRDAMRERGISFDGLLEADGKLHRINGHGDKKGRRNVWYVLHLDGVPSGAFGSLRLYGIEKFKWSAKGTIPMTLEERKEMDVRIRAARLKGEKEKSELYRDAAARAQAMWSDATEIEADEHPYLVKKRIKAFGARIGDWIKTFPPDRDTGEIHQFTVKNALLVPLRDGEGNIVSLQAIFAKTRKVAGELRGKEFVFGGQKRGCWFSICNAAKINEVQTVVVCEGFATGASIHMATGLDVIVAFDAGNLRHVAETIRKMRPNARILIAADNDQFTTRPVENPGVHYAMQAARTIRGEFIFPQFADLTDSPTDFNDLHTREGVDVVKAQFDAVLNSEVAVAHTPAIKKLEMTLSEKEAANPDIDPIDTGGYFKILGHSRDRIFIFQFEKKLIVDRGEADWSEAVLTSLAPLHWWEMNFPGKHGMERKMAVNWIQRTAYARGFYNPSIRRGRGAWIDEYRTLYHFGDRLMVDGVEMDFIDIKSRYVYEQGEKLPLPADLAMTDAEGLRLLEIADMFRWKNPASALLMLGWTALAPYGGVLGWRPHVWLTGGAGSGKTTILLDFVGFLLNGNWIGAQGNSTEAGIRQTLKTDSLPVLFDESEQNGEREIARGQNILSMIRQASTASDLKTMKGTVSGNAMDFKIGSMFMLSSIQVGLKHQADLERFTVLNLKSKRDVDGADHSWTKTEAQILKMHADRGLPARLMRRSLELLPVTLVNIKTFARVAAKKFGTQRDGDQFGTLLAGAWSMTSRELVTEGQAAALLDRYDWSEYVENSQTDESSKALSAILGAQLHVPGGGIASVYELVTIAAGRTSVACDVDQRTAKGILERHGLRVKFRGKTIEDADLLFANSSIELPKLVKGTPYESDLMGQIGRVEGASKSKPLHFNGQKSRGIAVPLSLILEQTNAPDEIDEEAMPF
tara:strand:- start:2739 stop:5627 length:2889 start_codon:yes stop_codon:yes gene_type:complete